MFFVAAVGLLIGYILNNYILTVNENEKGEFFKPNFDKNRTIIILAWNVLIPVILFKVYDGIFCVDFFRNVVLNALCSAVFFIDFKLHIIPNILNLIALILGCICLFFDKFWVKDFIIAAIIGLSIFLIIIVFSKLVLKKDGMGLGDAKFMCVVGLLSGIVNTIGIIFFSFIFGSIGAIVLLISNKKEVGQEIAFGPYIVMATMIFMFFGNYIFNWYFNIL